jgi:hypothetical protein
LTENTKNTRTVDELVVLPELESIVPDITEKEKTLLSDSILHVGVQVPILIATINEIKNVIVDGHHRYHAVKNLGTRLAPQFRNIPVKELSLHQVQDAKALSIDLNLDRRHLKDYPKITWCLEGYKGIKTQEQIRDFLRFKTVDPIKKVSALNNRPEMKESAPVHLPVFVSDWIKEVKFGTEKDTNEKPMGYGGLLNRLQDGENSQNWIDNKTEGNDQLKAKMTEAFFEIKYKIPFSACLKKMKKKLYEITHPEEADKLKQEYYEAYQKFYKATQKLSAKYPDWINLFQVATESKANDVLKAIKFRAAELDKGVWSIVFYDVPIEEEVK